MNLTTKMLVVVYSLVAIFALIFTWYHVPAYLGSGILNANLVFWKDAIFNTSASGKFLTVDILFLTFTCNLWMFIEGRRLKIRFLYIYVVGGILIAISVAFPLFMAARELRLAADKTKEQNYPVKFYDTFTLLLLFSAAIAAGILAI